MNTILLLVCTLLAAFGLFLVVDFLIWQMSGRMAMAQVVGFRDKKSKGHKLPVVSIAETKGDEGLRVDTARIDQFLYILSPPQEGDFISVVYQRGEPPRARVFGYMHLIFGLLLLIPAIALVGQQYGKSLLAAQSMFILILAGILIGGVALLKLIQRKY